jgi:excinuclease ABC subunit A
MAKKKIAEPGLDKHHIPESGDVIHFHGVKTHNLKNIDVSIPKNKITTVTGVSGSGKSSFAFDTLYKEGQYRYIESLSSYLRQFFNLGTRPEIDYCSGLSPAIAIEQNKRAGNSRSTVGTLTEIDDYLRLLLAKLWDLYCYGSGKRIQAQSIDQIIEQIFDDYKDQKIYLVKELGQIKEEEKLGKFVKKNRKDVDKSTGFSRYLITYNNEEKFEAVEYFYLETPNIPAKNFPIKVYGIFDRITIEQEKRWRIKEDIIKILAEVKKFGVYVPVQQDEEAAKPKKGKAATRIEGIKRFTDKMYSPDIDVTYPEFTSQHFSPNRQEWACPDCHGIGEVLQVDFDKIIDPSSSLMDAVLPRRDSAYGQGILKKLAQKYSVDPQETWKALPERFIHVVLNGDNELLRVQTGDKYISINYKGIEDIIKDQYVRWLLTVDFQAMLDMSVCPTCHGARIRKESMHVFLTVDEKKLPKNSQWITNTKAFAYKKDNIADRPYAKPIQDGRIKYNIDDLQHMTLHTLVEFMDMYVSNTDQPIQLAERIIRPLLDRARIIDELGLDYITLHRQISTLSGWEIQRLRLAKQLGNKLTGIIYVLDEPTIGLSDKEIQKTIHAIKKLQAMGNTIVVVEHQADFIKASDWVVEIGPGAWDFGGNVTFSGPYDKFIKSDCLTAQYITGRRKVQCDFNHHPSNKKISIKKASKFNLANIDVDIRLGSFTIITWASGAGKTTLMYSTLYKFLSDKQKFVQSYIRLQLLKKGRSRQEIIAAPVMNKKDYEHYENIALQEFYKEISVETISGHEEIKNMVYVDQSSIGKTPRSCPVTFIGTFDKIRSLYAGTTEAKYLGLNSSHFSFNSAKGTCPACNWYGYKKVELQFLPDTYVPCELCQGHRYKKEIMDIKRHGKGIHEILHMYISDAMPLFEDIPQIYDELKLLCDIGLGYLRMGQPAHTLSGGESQRLKLVKHLLKQYKGHTIYFLDEPTVGLHDVDIEKLLRVIKEFLDNGDTILMIEHDKNLLQFADDIINLENGYLVK